MSLEAARNLSIPELLRVLNDKLHSECNRLQEYHPPLAVSISFLETEVSALSSHLNHRGEISPIYRKPLDQKSRGQSTRRSETHSLAAEPIATGQQGTTRDSFAYRSMFPVRRCRRGREADCSVDPRMPLLARLHHIRPHQLEANITLQQGLDGVDP